MLAACKLCQGHSLLEEPEGLGVRESPAALQDWMQPGQVLGSFPGPESLSPEILTTAGSRLSLTWEPHSPTPHLFRKGTQGCDMEHLCVHSYDSSYFLPALASEGPVQQSFTLPWAAAARQLLQLLLES